MLLSPEFNRGLDFLETSYYKEIYIHLLAYNLLRTVMWQSGTQKGVNPLRISL